MRVVVVNQSEQLRQVLQYVIENGIDVELVGETTALQALPQQLRQLRPEWLFLLQEEYSHLTNIVDDLLERQPTLHIILLTADGEHIRFQRGSALQQEIETWPQYSLSEFIHFLKEFDPSPVAVKSFENVGEGGPPKFVHQPANAPEQTL
ncbi:MAG: response regulator transcription factor [Caldilineaceae bacterium]|nr:response regulator transcription factor [Caldilineaceae bacterium]